VTPLANGTATCRWLLATGADKRISKLTAHWTRLTSDEGDYFLSSASVYAMPEDK
jgi:hypothetical protein